jgi:hypothetical protein
MATPSLATVGGLEFPIAYPGQLVTLPGGGGPDIDTMTNENVTAVDFGAAVSRGVSAAPGVNQNCKPVAGTTVVAGFAVRALSEANTTVSAGTVNYPQYSEVPVLKNGVIAVVAAEAAVAGDAAVIVAATPTTVGTAGAGGSAANGTTRLACGATWLTTTGVGVLGLIRVSNNA